MLRSCRLIAHSLRLFWKQPALLMPLIVVWMFQAVAVIYLKYSFPWQDYQPWECFGILFLVVASFSVSLTVACTWLLEMLKQSETGAQLSYTKPLLKTLFIDLPKVLPIAMIWAVLWFTLSVVDVLLSRLGKEKNGDPDAELSAESAARTLAGLDHLSLHTSLIQMLQKGIRMIVFLILPAVVWEGLGSHAAIWKGLRVFRFRLKEFTFGYALTLAAAMLIFLPAAVFIQLGSPGENHRPPMIVFSQEAWLGLIIYIGLCTSFCLYLEQMFGAGLYLWHLKWEQACAEADRLGEKLPLFKSIPPPNLLLTFSELQDFLPVFNGSGPGGELPPLHEAIIQGDIDRVEELLSRGADPNAPDAAGQTPLDSAIGTKNLDIIKLLMAHGARDTAGHMHDPTSDFLQMQMARPMVV